MSFDHDTAYPALVVESLGYAKTRGMSFDDAWALTMETLPPTEFGFGSATSSNGGVETPMRFFRRHCEANWHRMGTFKYCDVDACPKFAVVGSFCFSHFIASVVEREAA